MENGLMIVGEHKTKTKIENRNKKDKEKEQIANENIKLYKVFTR